MVLWLLSDNPSDVGPRIIFIRSKESYECFYLAWGGGGVLFCIGGSRLAWGSYPSFPFPPRLHGHKALLSDIIGRRLAEV